MPVAPDDDTLDEEQEEELFLDEEDEEFPEEELELDDDLESSEDSGPRRATSAARAVELSEGELRAKLAGADPTSAVPYALNGSFSTGDFILHAQFGLGIVSNILSSKKMKVIFQESVKLLVMNYTPLQ